VSELEANQLTGEAEGTSIYVNDSADAKVRSIGLVGRTTQESTTGKNKFPFISQDFTLGNIRFYVQDGSLYLNGTSSGETSSKSANFKNNFKVKLPAGTYVISHKTGVIALYLYNADTNDSIVNVGRDVSNQSFTLTEEADIYMGFYIYQVSFNNANTEIMIRPSSITDDTYEPYTGRRTST
jgi:hypothetical protein